METLSQLVEILTQFLRLVSQQLPDDVLRRLDELRDAASPGLEAALYVAMSANLEKANTLSRPICQDTGVVCFFVRVGDRSIYREELRDALLMAVTAATNSVPLRHNAVDVFDDRNTGTNTGERVPFVSWDMVPGSDIEIDVYLAGGGSSLPGRSVTMIPIEGLTGVAQYVVDTVLEYGINACPPLVVGVGIAGSADIASVLSKKALLRSLGSVHHHPRGAEFEAGLLHALNSLGVGAQGLPGSNFVMGVHVESAARHPASLAVGVSVGCWAHRRGTLVIGNDLKVSVTSHRGVLL